MPAKPNLFIIGAMKSGTTSLHRYLSAHPDIYMSDVKEPGYFVEEIGWRKGEDWYASLFADSAGSPYVGESSTHYTKLPLFEGVPQRLYAFNPRAKLLYIMRHPFERLVSHYWHKVRAVQRGGEVRSIVRVVEEDEMYIAVSHYAMQLRPYLDLFDRDAIYVLTLEELFSDPSREVNRIYDWLGLRAHDIGRDAGEIHNKKPAALRGVAGRGVLNRIQCSRALNPVSPFVPQRLKAAARRMAYRFVDEAEQNEGIRQLRARLKEIQRPQVEELSRLLGRDFPEWQWP